MADDITIDVGMDPSSYLSGSAQVASASSAMAASFGQVVGSSGALSRTLAAVTPGRAAIAAWAAMAKGAADVESSMSGLRGVSRVTDTDLNKLTGSMHNLARSFPVGNAGAQAMVTQFTQMGITGSGSEAKIASLAKATIQFAGATGTSMDSAGASLTDFSRATGNVKLNLKPYVALGDAVTSVAAGSGSSASAILGFGKMIAPMANQAGVGGAAIAGISGAFTKLGEDGLGATTAVNKMFSDMSRSVRDGTPDLAIYSQAVGKTTKEFTALYKANPAEAMTQVTEAIAKSTTGPRLLEHLGLDSVRTMKSLTALSASGGLRPAIAQGVAGYGSGISEEASKSAFSGLNEEATKLQASMGQVATAFGTPLLTPLTAFTKLIGAPVSLLSKIVGSSAGQVGMSVLGAGVTGVAGLMSLKGLSSALSTFGMGRQMATSMPVSGFAAGYAQSAGLQADSRIYTKGEQARIAMSRGVTPEMPKGWLTVGAAGPLADKAHEAGLRAGAAALDRRATSWVSASGPRGGADWAKGESGSAIIGGTPSVPGFRNPITGAMIGGSDAVGGVRAADHLPSIKSAMKSQEDAAYAMRQAGIRVSEVPSPLANGITRIRGWAGLAASSSFGLSSASKGQALVDAADRSTMTGYDKPTDALRTQTRLEDQNAPFKRTLPTGTGLQGVGTPAAGAWAAFVGGKAAAPEGPGQGTLGGLRAMDAAIMQGAAAHKLGGVAIAGAAKSASNFSSVMASAGTNIRNSAGLMAAGFRDVKAGGVMAGGAAARLGGFGGGLMGALSNPMMIATLGITGALSLGGMVKGAHDKQQAETVAAQKAFGESDVNDSVNRYRESIGKAASPAKAVVDVAPSTAPPPLATVADVRGNVTDEERAGAKSGNVVKRYAGKKTDELVAELTTSTPGGYSPAEFRAVRKDLIRQGVPESQVAEVSAAMPTGSIRDDEVATAPGELLKASSIKALAGGLNPLSDPTFDTGGNYVPAMKTAVTDTGKDAISGIVRGIGSAADAQKARAGAPYATQQTYRAAGAGLQALTDAGKGADVTDDYQRKVLALINPQGGTGQAPLSADELAKHGGSYADTLAARTDDNGKTTAFATQLAADKKAGLSTATTGGLDGKTLPGELSDMFEKAGDHAGAAMFSNKNTTGFGKALAAAILVPGDAGRQQTLIATSEAALGHSVIDPKDPAGRAAALGDKIAEMNKHIALLPKGGDQEAAAITVRDTWMQQQSTAYRQMAPSAQQSQRIAGFAADAAIATPAGTNPDIVAQQKAGKQGLLDESEAIRQRLIARLELQRNYQKSVDRSNEDFQLQQTYQAADYARTVDRTNFSVNQSRAWAATDYNLSVAHANQDFNKSKERQNRDFAISAGRMEVDNNTARLRATRDFNISATRAAEDFNKSRFRATRDFNLQNKRMVEDAASTMYDPYSRIQTKATWDLRNLSTNLDEQTAALAKQKKNLDTLRKRGVSKQTIDDLGLGKAENYQQVTNLTADTTDPAMVAKLNKAVADKSKAAGALVTDSSNKDLRRSKEDFARSQSDSTKDYGTSTKRNAADFAKSLGDMAKDYAKNVGRATADLHKGMSDQQFDFSRSISRGQAAFDLSSARTAAQAARNLVLMGQDNTRAIERAATAHKTSLTRMHTDIVDADKVINGDITTLQGALSKALAGKSGWLRGILKNDLTSFRGSIDDNVAAIAAGLARIGVVIPTVAAPPAGNNSRAQIPGTSHQQVAGKATGGTIGGFSPHPKADNIPIMATAGEFMHPVDAVKHYGVPVMEAMRTKRIPKAALAGYYDGGLVAFGHDLQKKGFQVSEHPLFGGVHPVHTPGSWHYRGGAIDVNHDQGNEKGAIDAILAEARSYHLRTLWQIVGHFNHAHFDIAKGPDMLGAGYKPGGTGGSGVGPAAGDITNKYLITKAMIMAGMGGHGGLYGTMYAQLSKALDKSFPAGVDALALGTGPAVSGPSTKGANPTLGKALADKLHGWRGAQYDALNTLWTNESGWNNTAQNPTSTAYGIAQFLDSTWAGYGGPKTSDAGKQITYGMKYIADRYTTPAKALATWQSRSPHWYDEGGKLPTGTSLVHNDTGKPETVLTNEQWGLVSARLSRDQGQVLSASSGMHMTVHHNETITYDNRVDFTGTGITVISQNPDDMARKLEAKAIAARISQTRGVRRG